MLINKLYPPSLLFELRHHFLEPHPAVLLDQPDGFKKSFFCCVWISYCDPPKVRSSLG